MSTRDQVLQPEDPAGTIGDQQMQSKLVHNRIEAATILGISVRTIDNLILNGELTVRRIGTRVVIPHHSIVQFIRRDHPTVVKVQ
jgi:excisionase family DNA binding protein